MHCRNWFQVDHIQDLHKAFLLLQPLQPWSCENNRRQICKIFQSADVKSRFARHSAIRLLISLLSKVVKSFALISLCISPNSIRFISVNGHSAILAFDIGETNYFP